MHVKSKILREGEKDFTEKKNISVHYVYTYGRRVCKHALTQITQYSKCVETHQSSKRFLWQLCSLDEFTLLNHIILQGTST